jgi:hypothetical protein
MPTRDDSATGQVKIRIKEPLRAAIKADADARGVTMNAVISDRLQRSFREDAQLRDLSEVFALALGADVAGFTLAIGLAIRDVVKWPALWPKPSLFSDASIFEQVVAAVWTLIDILRPAGGDAPAPPGGDDVPSGAEEAAEQWHTLGPNVSRQICWEIAEYPEHLGPWGSAIRNWLGPDAIEQIRAKAAAFYGAH